MKKLTLMALVLWTGMTAQAQTETYSKLKKLANTLHPELNTTDKLIAYHLWSVNDSPSREANKSFEKTATTFEGARLKGGLKGIVMIAINTDNTTSEATITLTKDGISKMIPVSLAEAGLEQGIPSSMVFDSSGNEVYRNLESSQVFESIRKLITR